MISGRRPVTCSEVPLSGFGAGTGNLTNVAVRSLFEWHLDAVTHALEEAVLVELGAD